MLDYIDAMLGYLEPILGGWLLIALAIGFVVSCYAAWTLAWDYFERAALSREYKAVIEEKEREERRRVALERIMASTAKYRERVN